MNGQTGKAVSPASGSHIDIINTTLVVLIVLTLTCWLIGFAWNWYRKTTDVLWFARIHRRYRDPTSLLLGSSLIATLVICGSIFIARRFMEGSELEDGLSGLMTSPGIVASWLGGIATVMTLLQTQIVRIRQESQIPDIGRLLEEASAAISERHKRAIGEGKKEGTPVDFYMLDYSPAIGEIPSPLQHKKFKSKLLAAAAHPLFNMYLLFSSNDLLDSFYADMGTTPNRAHDFITKLAIEKPTWRSNDIGQMHLIIIDDIAFQYVVLPEENKSRAVGVRTEDAYQVAFLKETIVHSLKCAITPDPSRCKTGGLELRFKAQQVDSDTDLIVEFCADKSFREPFSVTPVEKKLPRAADVVTIATDEIPDEAKFLRVIATKKPNKANTLDEAQSLTSLVREILARPKVAAPEAGQAGASVPAGAPQQAPS